jgi:hypothetical protein
MEERPGLTMDWRGKVIVGAVAALLAITLAIYLLAYGLDETTPLGRFFAPWVDPATEIGAVFAAWVGGLALFVIAGAFVAVVSLGRPEHESFDARARILFRRQSGRHIDYIVAKIKQVLEHYAERTKIKVAVVAYDATTQMYRTSRISETIVRSYLDDVQTDYVTTLTLYNVSSPPPGGVPNRLVYARVAGSPVGVAENFENGIERPLSCTIGPNGTCEVCTSVESWVRANTEPNTHKPVRYTQVLLMEFENLLDHEVVIKFSIDEATWETERFPPGSAKKFVEIKDVNPGKVALDYRIQAP